MRVPIPAGYNAIIIVNVLCSISVTHGTKLKRVTLGKKSLIKQIDSINIDLNWPYSYTNILSLV